MKVILVVVSDALAGTERYVANLAKGLDARGHEVIVVGGTPLRAAIDGIEWRLASHPAAAATRLAALRRVDVVNAHLTWAEAAAAATQRLHGAPIVSTRHLLTERGQSRVGRWIRPWIERRIVAEIAVSDAVAAVLPTAPIAVIRSGTTDRPFSFSPASRTVLVAQRLEREKATDLAIRAWAAAGLYEQGWRLVVAGEGAERTQLEHLVAQLSGAGSVSFVGHVDALDSLWSDIGCVLAPSSVESFGLTVLEAMSAGIPVVAAGAGGHLETVGRAAPECLTEPGKVDSAAGTLARLCRDDSERARIANTVQAWQRKYGSLDRQVDETEALFAQIIGEGRNRVSRR